MVTFPVIICITKFAHESDTLWEVLQVYYVFIIKEIKKPGIAIFLALKFFHIYSLQMLYS